MGMSAYYTRIRAAVGSEVLHIPSVSVLPRDDEQRVLLVRHGDGGPWGLIGGAIEPDESPHDAARREAREEVSVEVDLTELVGVMGGPEFRVHYANGHEVSYVSVVYNARISSGAPTPDNDEIRDVRWFGLDELDGADLDGVASATFRDLGLLLDDGSR
jgi:8-oxo-dGTP pyrophosphatase MutT (NUDIX family)